MGDLSIHESDGAHPTRRFLPLLLLLFAGSGCSALIYEIVWLQLLQLVIGSSAVSLGVLLGTFMGGMCLGSLLLTRLISVRRHPLRVYAVLEFALGLLGLAVFFGMPHVDRVYTQVVGNGMPAILLRGAVCAVCLLLPTMLMGATLPAIARWMESTRQGVAWLGFFYGGNLAGAVFGCLLAGFYLLRVHDMLTATWVAVGLNALVALVSFTLANFAPHEVKPAELAAGPLIVNRSSWPIYLTICISGACALAAEVIWTRNLSLLLGATVYTFSIILAVFLTGLGFGSSVGSFLGRSNSRPGVLLGSCQLLLAVAIAWTAHNLASSLPFWPIDPYLSRSPWIDFQMDLARCTWAIFPAACLWGASFPLALAACASRAKDPGRLVGGIYAANTLGAIVGSLGASLCLISWMGTQNAQRLLIGVSAAGAFLMLDSSRRQFVTIRDDGRPPRSRVRTNLWFVLLAFALSLSAIRIVRSIPATPWELVAFGRSLATQKYEKELVYMGEGLNASIAVTENAEGDRSFHVSGKVEASSGMQDMRLQRMLGHLPALFHEKPKTMLVVGFGAGVTSGSFLAHPECEHITICEIEPLIPKEIAPFFARQNYNVVSDPRVEIIYDDARHFILTTQRKFDIITSDPIHPWVKGSATLYTKEYFELCKQHLNPGGLITQWVPLYESTVDVVKSEIATFCDVFPHGTVWTNDQNGTGYDVVMMGQLEAQHIDADQLQERVNRRDHAAVAKSLEDVGFQTVVSLLSTYGGQAGDLQPWLEGAEINRDRNLRLQYLAGMGLNSKRVQGIQQELAQYRKFPEELFVGTRWRSLALRVAMQRSGSVQLDSEEK